MVGLKTPGLSALAIFVCPQKLRASESVGRDPLPAWTVRRLVIIGDGQSGAFSLLSGYHTCLLDSKVTPRQVTKMEFLPSLEEVRLEN